MRKGPSIMTLEKPLPRFWNYFSNDKNAQAVFPLGTRLGLAAFKLSNVKPSISNSVLNQSDGRQIHNRNLNCFEIFQYNLQESAARLVKTNSMEFNFQDVSR